MTRAIVIVDYDQRWPRLYEEEKKRILDVLRQEVVAIEHIGSTAVPGLGAKPIIDIMVGICRLTDADNCIEPLRRIGYQFHPPSEVGIPERRYFRKETQEVPTHHIHMVEQTSDFWKRHLLFRDFLRAHPGVALQYYRLKKELAAKYVSDVDAYTEAKTSFIESVVALACSGQDSNSGR